MGLKQKFMALAGVMGALMAIVSIIGYYMASSDLQQSIESEMGATVATEAAKLDGWLDEKKIVLETLTGIRRAGADMILTYFAKDVAKWHHEA